jgi:iron(III) transport system permease protein
LTTAALIIVLVQQRVRGRAALYTNRSTGEIRLQRLSIRARIGAWGFLGGLVTLALVIPVAILMWWMVRGLSLGNSPLSVLPHLTRSVLISGLAALVIAIAALPLGILVVRFPSRRTQMLESIPWLTYSLPHLAVGLAFLVLTIRLARPIYQTVVLLVLVYLAMFLPLALAAVESGMRRIGPGLEDASRSLGVGALGTLRRITIPLLRPSVLAGAALVFLSVMKELPATLLLRPTEFDTLPVRIWSATNELFYTQASFASLALIAASALPLYFFVIRDLHE